MSNRGIQDFAKILLLVGGAIALLGGLLGLVDGFVGIGPVLALVLGIVSLAYYGRLSSGSMLVILLLGIILTVITGGIAAFGGILVSIAALMFLVARYNVASR